MIKNITDSTFDEDVLQSEVPVLVDFWAPWCGPCRMVSPIVEELEQVYGDRITFMKMNTDENPKTPGTYGIRSIPTLLIIKGGLVVESLVGFRPKSELSKYLETVLSI